MFLAVPAFVNGISFTWESVSSACVQRIGPKVRSYLLWAYDNLLTQYGQTLASNLVGFELLTLIFASPFLGYMVC